MKIHNHSPFPHMLFESRTPSDAAIGVVVVTGTFAIVPNQALAPTEEQPGVHVGNTHHGKAGFSSMARESELVPFKPRSDIHLDAVARAPEDKPARSWPVRIQVGQLTKDLMVHGPHVWRHRPIVGWQKTRPQPCVEVPLRYERAFGGAYHGDAKRHVYRQNKLGTGWICKHTPRDKDLPAPQLLALDEPAHRPGGRYTPQGVGPMPPSWRQRLQYAGTYDEAWKDERWPCLPEDFDYRFYNSAHPDLIYNGYLRGDEEVTLVNLTSEGVTRFRLPGYHVFGTIATGDEDCILLPLRLDTLHMDVAAQDSKEHRIHLTWRGVMPWLNGKQSCAIQVVKQAPGIAVKSPTTTSDSNRSYKEVRAAELPAKEANRGG